MWLMTTRGFYSAVEKPEDRKEKLITVRARSEQHLKNLRELMSADFLENTPDGCFADPQHIGGHDYPWRIRLPHTEWDGVVKALSQDIAYDNFKSAVGRVKGSGSYVHALHDVWSDMVQVQKSEGKVLQPYA